MGSDALVVPSLEYDTPLLSETGDPDEKVNAQESPKNQLLASFWAKEEEAKFII